LGPGISLYYTFFGSYVDGADKTFDLRCTVQYARNSAGPRRDGMSKKKVVVRVTTDEKRHFVTAGDFKRGWRVGDQGQERAKVALELGMAIMEEAGLWD